MVSTSVRPRICKGSNVLEQARDFLTPLCESPIEIALGAELFRVLARFHDRFVTKLCRNDEAPSRAPNEVLIVPQFCYGRYRTDLAVRFPWLPAGKRWVFVECDGREFHSAERQVRAGSRSATGNDGRRILRVPVHRFADLARCRSLRLLGCHARLGATPTGKSAMSATSWGKWFWADWLADPGLRACSIGARGMWMDLLCVAATAEPPGYVTIAGRAMTYEEIARLTGVEIEMTKQLIEELLLKNVCGKSTLGGALFSRRIIRDAKKAAHAHRIGKLGGNPTLLKQKRNTPQDNGPLNQTMELGGGTNPNKPSNEKHKGKSGQDNGGVFPSARARARSTCQKLDKNLTSSVESESKPRPSKINGHPQPTSGPATALPEGRAGPQLFDSSKRPHELTKAEFEAQIEARRKT